MLGPAHAGGPVGRQHAPLWASGGLAMATPAASCPGATLGRSSRRPHRVERRLSVGQIKAAIGGCRPKGVSGTSRDERPVYTGISRSQTAPRSSQFGDRSQSPIANGHQGRRRSTKAPECRKAKCGEQFGTRPKKPFMTSCSAKVAEDDREPNKALRSPRTGQRPPISGAYAALARADTGNPTRGSCAKQNKATAPIRTAAVPRAW